MKVRTSEELSNIDSSLNLFEDTNWDFFGVLETQEPNYEYFDDVRDSSFDRNLSGLGSRIRSSLLIIFTISSFVIMLFIGIKVSGILNKDDYKNIKDIGGVQNSLQVSYVEGEVASNNDTRLITDILNSYCNIVSSESDYSGLYNYCKMTSSFADTYNSFTSKVEKGYDINDCYARSLRKYGSFCNLDEVTKVLLKDGVYYCYAKITIPSRNTMYEYVYENSYNFSKHFTSNNINEEEIVRYMIETLDIHALPKISQELCIKFIETSDGEFKILDDSIITSSCIDAYTECITQISKVVSNTAIK